MIKNMKVDSMPHGKTPKDAPGGIKSNLVGRLAKRNYTKIKSTPTEGLKSVPKVNQSREDVYLA